ncbi:hypothetical protein HDU79_011669 [Rhizoclosmatium sp. JEL0117]|nr:hypothetical protein HDU79_011669 [Rhizoclosmatium sp. JEL0117]
MTPGHTEATSTSKRTKESTLTTHRVAASVTSEDSEGDDDRNESQQKKGKPGRKPANDQPLNHQQARQRANQRAFRERRANELKTLQDEVKELKAKLEQATSSSSGSTSTDSALLTRIAALESENTVLKQFAFTFMKQAPVSAGLPLPLSSTFSASSFAFPDPLLYSSRFPFVQPDLLTLSSSNTSQTSASPPNFASVSPQPSTNDDSFSGLLQSTSGVPLPFQSSSFLTFRDPPLTDSTHLENNDDLLDFLNTPAPSTSRVPLATKLEIKDTDRCHIISVSEQLKAIPGLKQNTDLVDDLCDMFATCTFLGFTPAKMEESVGEVPEPVKKVEELKARIFEALEGEDEKVAELILGACHATHP